MEYCDSDLKKLFKSPIHLTEAHINTLLYYMLVALKYLHSGFFFFFIFVLLII